MIVLRLRGSEIGRVSQSLASDRRFRDPWLGKSPPRARTLMSGRGTQGEGFWGVSSGTGEPFVFVAACFSRANMSLSVESTRVESLVKIL